jgi:Ser/Thr protein kinase RdoA (MazF antagonist)
MAGGAAALRESLGGDHWPELELRAKQLVSLFFAVAPRLQPLVERASILRVPLQPCIRDIWHPHVLFVDDAVMGIVDFGALRPENVACDVARLLGSLARDQQADWQRGLAAFQRVRPLSDEELILVSAFDRSTVLMGGLQWLQWIYLERREFGDRAAVLERIDEFLARLATLWNAPD